VRGPGGSDVTVIGTGKGTAARRAGAAATVTAMPRPVEIRGQMIRLGQLLKLAGVTDSGSDVKVLLAEGAVTVNGEVETRRGRQLHHHDIVKAGSDELQVKCRP